MKRFTDAGVMSFLMIFIFAALFHHPANSRSQIDPAQDNVLFMVGEELTYNVSYIGFDLGQVKIRVLEKVSDSISTSYKAIAYMDTYRGVPLVDLHSVFESTISDAVHSNFFQARDKDNGSWKLFKYLFDYENNRVFVEQGIWNNSSIDRRDTIGVDTFYQDGLSLFYYARAHLKDKKQVRIPVFVSEKKGHADIRFTGRHEKETIDAVNYPIDVLYFDGRAEFIGVFGLTGGFEGWFSNDEARVPILAKMKVIIGNIRIELMEWKRPGWSPPRFSEGRK